MSEVLDDLAERYSSRIASAHALADNGSAVVGVVGSDLPRSIVTAAGAVPLRLYGSTTVSDEAFRLLGRGVDTATLSLLTRILEGELDFVRGILVTHDCQASVLLFYVLRELQRSGRLAMPVALVDLVHLDREPTLAFDIVQLRNAAALVGSWCDTAVTAESLRDAMLAWQSVDRELERVQQARRSDPPRISGTDALHAFGVASALPPDEAIGLIRGVADAPESGTATGAAIRLFVTGSSPIGDSLYRALESASVTGSPVTIVGEDHDWGDLALTVRPQIPPIGAELPELFEALARGLLSAAPAAPTSGQQSRGRATRSAIEASGASALVSVVRDHDDAAAWDFPHQRTDAGVACVILERQPPETAAHELAAALAEVAAVA